MRIRNTVGKKWRGLLPDSGPEVLMHVGEMVGEPAEPCHPGPGGNSITFLPGLGTETVCNQQCCGAGRSRGFLAGARADLNLIWSRNRSQFLGRLRLLFWQVKMKLI